MYMKPLCVDMMHRYLVKTRLVFAAYTAWDMREKNIQDQYFQIFPRLYTRYYYYINVHYHKY